MERKHHEGIDIRKEKDCGDAICIGGHKLSIGNFDRIESPEI